MGVDRPAKSQGVLEQDVLGGVGQMLLTTNDVGDAHELVVHHHGQVIGRVAVGLEDDEVVELSGGHGGLAANHVVNRDLARLRCLEADDVRALLGQVAGDRLRLEAKRGPVVAVGMPLRLPGRLQLLRCLERPVGPAGFDEPLGVVAVVLQTLRLVIGARFPPTTALELRSLVPLDGQPREILQDRSRGRFRGALAVGVLNAQEEAAALGPGIRPAEESRAGAAHVEMPRRAGRKAGAHWGRRRSGHCEKGITGVRSQESGGRRVPSADC